ncbi:MAG: nucleotidyl transferase AbiEii/AbiGii toxin family protein [Chloroflexota bacterium]|nr:nucleotidyl transferase AbiEii/AbiGii toxin family protein [Chloroflexota bacterium]MDQ6907260.1 nucleotidyl transferase AbiEii/AbiGii toxin family protein [Chloroflexota bacterium]
MTVNYPGSFATISSWANRHNTSVTEARQRFAQYGILRAIATSQRLSGILVFKGGNALDFIWQPNRSTVDLDFSADMRALTDDFDERILQRLLERSLSGTGRLLGITFSVHSVSRQPPGEGKTFVTLTAKIGYALEDDDRNRARIDSQRPSMTVIPIEISLNEPVCADIQVLIDATHQLRVSSLEDIIAEKLRALLQQPLCNRTRRQDLLDIAVILQSGTSLDRSSIAAFLIEKARARDVPVSRTAFRDPEIARRASEDYHALANTTRAIFISFDEALRLLLTLTDDLLIPE